MKKVLSQEEINALIRAAGPGAKAADPRVEQPSIVPWDGRLAGRVGQEHMQAINQLHQAFAANLAHALGAYLRIQFEAALVSGEYLSYGEFLQSIPEVTYLASCKMMPVGVSVLMQLDLSVAYPLIDVLLGGEGKGEAPARGITEIEELILETVMHIICRELHSAWQALSFDLQFEHRQHPGQVGQLMATVEKILLLSFEITLLDSRGTLNLVVPAVISNTLLRKMSERPLSKPRVRFESERRLHARLRNCPFEAELAIPSLRVPMRALAELTPGSLLGLGLSIEHPATLFVAEQKMFSAKVARRGSARAAEVIAGITKPESEKDRKKKS
jgi:flagellar motor switch protein FliM